MTSGENYTNKIKDWLKEPVDEKKEEFYTIKDEENNCDIVLSYNGKIIQCIFTKIKNPIKLSKVEYEVLKWIQKEYSANYIYRDKSRALFASASKPDKKWDYWLFPKFDDYGGLVPLITFEDLFQFVKWENAEPIKIQDILNNCEIKEE